MSLRSRADRGGLPRYTLDVFVEGGAVHRGADVEIRDDALCFGDQVLACDSVFWVSRRAGLLLLFADEFTTAIKGRTQELEEVARQVERRLDRSAQRRLLEPVAREVIVWTAGAAAAGRLHDVPVNGLHLALVTQRGLHLVSRERRHTVPWPVDSAERAGGRGARGHEALVLRGDDVSMRLLYLFPEEIQAAQKVATTAPPPRLSGGERALEMFARSEVAPPVPAELPEFTAALEMMRDATPRALEVVRAGEPAPMPEGFFEQHFRDLSEIALGPVVLRASAASGADSLARAVEALDAEELRGETRAAVSAAANRLEEVYDVELGKLIDRKRPPADLADSFRLTAAERTGIEERMQSPIERLEPRFDRLSSAQAVLLDRLQALESSPPDSGSDGGVASASDEWRSELQRLDRAYGSTWRELLDEAAGAWSKDLGPRLARVSELPGRTTPSWVGPVVLVCAAALVLILLIVVLF